ncbi:MAG: hypothetical protein B7X31_00050 [Thiomonas sp. 13-66-29]|jgi:hypothetical protein|nr:MAG: hypothetical protein B7X46_01420 [Thiomonas sp. 15-66-11]OZB66204.1 MAG: hypothetical protein B7X31_00050 [Thiomonas sp. 13-66-29]
MGKSQPPKDPLGQHVRVYYRLMDCHAWRALPPAARALWLDLCRQAGATKNGTCGTHLKDSQGDRSGLHGRGWASHHTVLRAARELECLGFIEKEVQGGKAGGGKTPNLWSLTHLDVFDMPHKGIKAHSARHTYQRWQSVEQAREALRTMHAQEKSKRQNLPLQAADSALSDPELTAHSAKQPKAKEQKLPLAGDGKKRRKPSIGAGSKAAEHPQESASPTMADSAHPNSYAMGREQIGTGGKPQAARLAPRDWRH